MRDLSDAEKKGIDNRQKWGEEKKSREKCFSNDITSQFVAYPLNLTKESTFLVDNNKSLGRIERENLEKFRRKNILRFRADTGTHTPFSIDGCRTTKCMQLEHPVNNCRCARFIPMDSSPA